MPARTVVVLCAVCRGPLHLAAHQAGVQVLCPPCYAAPPQPLKLAGNPYPVPMLSSSAVAVIYPQAQRPRSAPRIAMRIGCDPPDEDDLELAYPDTAEDLELVYPEDAALAASSQPTPTLAGDSLRRCQTPRCNETLPAHSSMDYCSQCSFDDWKRRTTSSIKAHDIQRTVSLETTTSTEEKEVVAILDDMSDVEQPPSSFCTPSASTIVGWDSDLTNLTSSESDSDSESTSDDQSTSDSDVEPDGDSAALKIRIPLLVTHLPAGSVLRKCANKRCNIALAEEHRWKTCDACRRFQRMYQRLRAENARRGVLGMEPLADVPCEWRSLSQEPNPPLTSRRCSGCHKKRLPAPEAYPWKTCEKCRAKSRRMWHRRRDALREDIVPHAPAYQNRAVLLSSFETQLRGFVEGQLLYYRAKLCDKSGEDPCKRQLPMMFVFAGEYSVVIGQKDEGAVPEVDQEAIYRDVSGVVAEMERVLHATLKPGKVTTIDRGISMQFTCSLELIARLRPLAIEGALSEDELSPPVPFVKAFSGELEAVVVPDESHRLFHGRRMVLRYRMIG